jgi:hypothetical protein
VVDHVVNDREQGRDVPSVAGLAEFPLGWRLGMPSDLSSQGAEMFGLRGCPCLILGMSASAQHDLRLSPIPRRCRC